MIHQWGGDLPYGPGISVSWYASGVGVRLVPSNMFSNFLTDTLGSFVCGVFLLLSHMVS